MTKELMNKINQGMLNDDELEEAIEFFTDVIDKLELFGKEFELCKIKLAISLMVEEMPV